MRLLLARVIQRFELFVSVSTRCLHVPGLFLAVVFDAFILDISVCVTRLHDDRAGLFVVQLRRPRGVWKSRLQLQFAGVYADLPDSDGDSVILLRGTGFGTVSGPSGRVCSAISLPGTDRGGTFGSGECLTAGLCSCAAGGDTALNQPDRVFDSGGVQRRHARELYPRNPLQLFSCRSIGIADELCERVVEESITANSRFKRSLQRVNDHQPGPKFFGSGFCLP